jgi:hypothetical protein
MLISHYFNSGAFAAQNFEDTYKIKMVSDAAYNHQFYGIYKTALHICIHQQKTSATLLCSVFHS